MVKVPYNDNEPDGKWMGSDIARTRPTWVPNTLLNQDYEIKNLEVVNYFNQLVFGRKYYKVSTKGNIREFINGDWKKSCWILVGLRCGEII